jgi:F0F1-type ATP synthase epsilon subunit
MAKKSKLPVASSKPIPVKIVSEPATSVKESDARERRWRAEDDIRTMKQAEEIKKDKARVKAMKEVAKAQMAELKKIC